MPNIFRTWRPTKLKLGTQTEHEDPHQRQAPWPPRLLGRLFTSRAIMRTSLSAIWAVAILFESVIERNSKVTRPINAETGSASYLPNGKAYELQTWYTNGARRPVLVASAVISKVKGQGCKVTWCVWQVLADKSRRKSPRNTNIGRKIVHPTGHNVYQFQGQRQRSRSSCRHNVETGSASYLPNGKAYELQTWCTGGGRRPVSPWWTVTSKVKGYIAMSCGESDRCWLISLEQKVPETSKLVSGLRIHEQ